MLMVFIDTKGLSLYFDSGIYHSFCLNGLRSGSEGKDTLLEGAWRMGGREQKKLLILLVKKRNEHTAETYFQRTFLFESRKRRFVAMVAMKRQGY